MSFKGLRLATQNLQQDKNAELVFNNLQESFSLFDFRFIRFPFRTHGRFFFFDFLKSKRLLEWKCKQNWTHQKQFFTLKSYYLLDSKVDERAVKNGNNSSSRHINSFRKKKSWVAPKRQALKKQTLKNKNIHL